MPQDIFVSASWRDIPILDEVPLSDVTSEGAFLATEAPLPVGTMLILTPASDAEGRVPARVAEVREALGGKGADANVPGMRLVFEAASGLQAFLQQRPGEQAGKPEEIGAGEEADLGEDEDDFSTAALPAAASRSSGDYAEISTSSDAATADDAVGGDGDDDLDEDEETPNERPREVMFVTSLPKTAAGAMDSTIAPQASGEIDLSQMHGSRYSSDPEAPDKVIVEVDRPEVARPEVDQPAAVIQAAEDQDGPSFDDVEADTKVELKGKKRKGKGKKRKKKSGQ